MSKSWTPLKKGDLVQIIAPSSTISASEQKTELNKIVGLLSTWGLETLITSNIFGTHAELSNLANTDQNRYQDLTDALLNPNVKAIWCLRGGYGSIRLLESLNKLDPRMSIQAAKLFIGFSDITLLHIYMRQRWDWNTIHGPGALQVANHKINADDITSLREMIFGQLPNLKLNDLKPMNETAKKSRILHGIMCGGNLTLVSRTLGTPYSIDARDKIFFLEDIDEPARKIDGMLQQLKLAGFFAENTKPMAIIFGDFSSEVSENLDIQLSLQSFADMLDSKEIPVLRSAAFGHGSNNRSIPLGPTAELRLGTVSELTIATGFSSP